MKSLWSRPGEVIAVATFLLTYMSAVWWATGRDYTRRGGAQFGKLFWRSHHWAGIFVIGPCPVIYVVFCVFWGRAAVEPLVQDNLPVILFQTICMFFYLAWINAFMFPQRMGLAPRARLPP